MRSRKVFAATRRFALRQAFSRRVRIPWRAPTSSIGEGSPSITVKIGS
jgi:hypothetical protein